MIKLYDLCDYIGFRAAEPCIPGRVCAERFLTCVRPRTFTPICIPHIDQRDVATIVSYTCWGRPKNQGADPPPPPLSAPSPTLQGSSAGVGRFGVWAIPAPPPLQYTIRGLSLQVWGIGAMDCGAVSRAAHGSCFGSGISRDREQAPSVLGSGMGQPPLVGQPVTGPLPSVQTRSLISVVRHMASDRRGPTSSPRWGISNTAALLARVLWVTRRLERRNHGPLVSGALQFPSTSHPRKVHAKPSPEE